MEDDMGGCSLETDLHVVFWMILTWHPVIVTGLHETFNWWQHTDHVNLKMIFIQDIEASVSHYK